jgi:asparagine synthetase B (glutamine-hydrolysing)
VESEGREIAIATEIKSLVAAGHNLNAVRAVIPGIHYQFDGALTQVSYVGSQRRKPRPLRAPCLSRLRSLIQEAVREQVMARESQHAVAVLFSGGIDSTIIAYESARLGIRRAFTVALNEQAPDALHARVVAQQLDLDWQLVIARPAAPEVAVVAGEIANRSIVEELTMHLHLAAQLQAHGIHIALTGCGADELFIGYEHLLGRLPHAQLQHRFLSTYYRFDLRAMNKLYGGFQVELRNPFLRRRIVDYATRLPAQLLIGERRKLKAPLRAAYEQTLGEVVQQPKLIARETMGAKAFFRARLGESPYCFRPTLKKELGCARQILRALARAPSVGLIPSNVSVNNGATTPRL